MYSTSNSADWEWTTVDKWGSYLQGPTDRPADRACTRGVHVLFRVGIDRGDE